MYYIMFHINCTYFSTVETNEAKKLDLIVILETEINMVKQ